MIDHVQRRRRAKTREMQHWYFKEMKAVRLAGLRVIFMVGGGGGKKRNCCLRAAIQKATDRFD